jgi:hypothetical protein
MLARAILYVLIFLIELAIFAKFRSVKVRQACLLAGSCALYLSWGIWFGAVLLASIVMNYLLGAWIRRTPSALILWTGILLVVAEACPPCPALGYLVLDLPGHELPV